MIQKKNICFITFVFLNFFNYVSAHEIKPTVVEFKKIENQINLVLIFNAEAFLANVDASIYKETKNSSKSKIYDELRLLSKEMLKERVFKSKDQITNSIFVKTSEKPLKLKVVEIDVLDENNIEKVRFTKIYFKTYNQIIETPIKFSTKKILDL